MALAKAEQDWYYLKLPFNLNPLYGFYDQPRTVDDAEANNYEKIGSCGDSKK